MVAIMFYSLMNDQSDDIFNAVKQNDLSKVAILLNQDSELANATQGDHVFISILQEAIIQNNYALVDILLKNGADVNYISEFNTSNTTPLHCANNHMNKNIIELLLKHDANPNIKTVDDITPFEDLCQNYSNIDIVNLYIKYGARVNNTDILTYLLKGISLSSNDSDFKNRCKILELLINNGANINKNMLYKIKEISNLPQDKKDIIMSIILKSIM